MHDKKNSGENPYQCDFCGESFHRNDKLKRHIKTRHSIIVTRRPGTRQQGPVIIPQDRRDGLFEIVQGEQ